MLIDEDFPTMAQGNRVYARTQSSPIAICTTDAIAVEIRDRLNFSDTSGFKAQGPST